MQRGMFMWLLLTGGVGFVGIAGAGIAEDPDSSSSSSHMIRRRSTPTPTNASIGESCILRCEVDYDIDQWSEVEHIINWRKQGIEVPIFIQYNGYPPHIDAGYRGRIRLVERASIEINDIRIEDEGWFECTIVFIGENEDSNTNGTWTYLKVHSPPVLGGVSPSFLIRKEGDTVDFYCDAAATPVPTLTWHKDNKELTPSERVIITGNRVQVRDLVRSDAGVYKCLFKNRIGEVFHNIRLILEGDEWITSGNTYISVPPKNITAKEREKVTLTCQAEGYPNNITYQWFKNDVDTQTITSLMSRSKTYADGGFSITSLEKEDSGWYKCRPSNGLGPPPEAKAYLNVTYVPEVLAMPDRLYLPRGMVGRIECPVLANPPVNRFTWTKNDDMIDPLRDPRLTLTKQGALVFKSVRQDDEGFYACTPHATTGTGHASSPVEVFVRDPPYFTVRPSPIYQRQPTQQVTMPCQADGDPKPSVIWRKADGTTPPITRTLQNDGNLTIVNLAMADHGVYECVASNVVTSVIITSLLLMESNTPHAPYNVTVHTGQHSAKVSWFPAYDQGYPQHYVLWFRRKKSHTGYKRVSDEDDEWKTIQVIPADSTSITVYALQADTEYEFTVLSRNRFGDGLFSAIVTARTNDATNIGITPSPTISTDSPGPRPPPPQNITIIQQKDGLMIRWTQPPSNLPIIKYLIEYRTIGPWDTLTTVTAENTRYLWTTASRGATYRFRIFTYTDEHTHSEASKAQAYSTTGPVRSGVRISDGMIGGIVGGLLFLFITVILAVLAVKIFNKRKQREKAMRYGNVKYFGPNHMDSNTLKGATGNHDGHTCVMAEIDAIPITETNHCSASSSPLTHVKTVKETPI